MDLSIIIVNWHSKKYIEKCITSLLANTKDIRFEIIVIDNASFDGTFDVLKRSFPKVQLLQSYKNVGFAMANNLAYYKSIGKYILFLNPDTEIINPAVNKMFEFLCHSDSAGAVGCQLLNKDNTIQTSCIQSFPTITNQLLSSKVLRKLFPKSSLWGMEPLCNLSKESKVVEALSGACIMVKRSLFEKIGLFSEDYFMYTEDIDLCYKIRQEGYKCFYIPHARVLHYGGGSTANKVSNFSAITMRDSIWRFLKKTKGENYAKKYRSTMKISAIGRLEILLIILPVYILQRKIKFWKNTFSKWKAIYRWSSYYENIN